MAKFAQRSTILSFLVCFLLLSAITPAFGRGSRDVDLSAADELIAAKEYDQATLLLTDYVRRNPERFEYVNVRLRKINQIREEFNQNADELIYVLLNEPENSEKILALTTKLRSLENENSPLMVNFVAKTQEIAQFNVYRNQLRSVLARGRELLDAKNSEGAMQAYAGGMGIMREQFFEANYGSRIDDSVRRETDRINSLVAAFRQESTQLASISNDLSRALNSGQQTRVVEQINRLSPAIDRFTEMRRNLFNSVYILDQILEELRTANPDMGERNYLAFVSRVIHGRANESIQEGMLGAFEASWQNSIGSVIEAIASDIESIYTANLTSFRAKDYAAVTASSSRNESYFNIAPTFFEKHMLFEQGSDEPTILMYGETILLDDVLLYLRIVSLGEAGNILKQAANVTANKNVDNTALSLWQQGRISLTEALNREQQTRNNYAAMQTEIDAIITKANQTDAEINTYYTSAHIKNAISAVQNMSNDYIGEVRQSAQRYYSIEYYYLEQNLNARKAELQKGNELLDGQRITSPDGSSAVHRFPAEALEQFTAMLASLSTDIEHGNSVLTQFGKEPQPISTNTEISGLRTRYQGLVTELNGLRTQGIALSDTARSRSALAQTHRQEGERLFREAQTAFQRQNFNAARQNIEQAAAQFNSSLEIQESASLRQTWNTQLVNLGTSIAVAENEAIIAEVRNLVNNARNLYFSGDFQQAETSLARANDRWRVTNTTENEEVRYWLDMVRGGTTARAVRVIPPTAPLFPEMSQLLSQAQRNYEEGVRYINAGQRTQGLSKFDEARLQTREVKLIFPVNQEAGLLEMKMEQFTDPAAFNASFEQRMRTAINGTKQRSWEAYADLLNLAEINPRYPGITAIRNQAEIDMGIRPPPPNPANLARSRELTASASRILEGNQSAQFEVAMTQINEALVLDPNNAEAARVKDRLQSRMNVGAIVLSSEDEEQYQRALREFTAGNNLVAMALVDRLLQNPRNRNITKLVDLQRRIQSVL